MKVLVLFLLACLLWLIPLHAAEQVWPYSSPVSVAPPSVIDQDRVRNPLDAFILKRLEENELNLAPEASRRTLIRRLYFDLIGLPPTPKEVESFVEDEEPEAYEMLVDRLLKDSRYGERWARFWLDLARYADTAGYEGDPDTPHAWRYRDYVIDAFNDDKPYDQFIKEQIAGDEFKEIMGAGELPLPSGEQTVAMTFLRLAPFTEPRGDETRHEMLSEMTSTVGSVFLGLTVGCAKCHDHKYDRIPTKDFYRMKSFFSTVQLMPPDRGDAYQIGGALPAEFYRNDEKEWAQKKREQFERVPKELAALKAELEERLHIGGAGFGMQSMEAPSGNNYYYALRKINDGKLHHAIVNTDGSRWRFFSDGSPVTSTGSLAGHNRGNWFGDIEKPRHVSLGLHTAGSGSAKGAAHKGAFAEILVYDHPLTEAERKQVDAYVRGTYQSEGKNGNASPPLDGLKFWLDASDLDGNPSTPNPKKGSRVSAWVDRVHRIQLIQKKEKLQPVLDELGDAGAPAVRFKNNLLVGDVRGASFLGDQEGSIVVVFSAEQKGEGYGFEVGGENTFVTTVIHPGAKGGIDQLLNDLTVTSISDEERSRYRELSVEASFVKQNLKRLQPVAMSLRHSFGPPYEAGVPTSRVMIRGEYNNPGEVVEAGFLSGITGNQQPAKIRLDPFKRWPTRSRRMTLAEWIASPDNPLTSRVMVNRLWHRHFGQGIVRTLSDFGKLSGGPSHPELLDWLAIEFIEAKWSIKAMQRLIVTSSTYRQSSQFDNLPARQLDPDNRLLWHFNRRRLEGEAIRDSILTVSGRLNPEQFGLPIFPPLPGDIAEKVKYNSSKWNTQDGPEGRKRSIYIYQQRTLTMPLMQTFDSLVCDESRPSRRTSVTPLQALALYNGEFVNEEVRHFASRVRERVGDDVGSQVRFAFGLALSRGPTDAELKQMSEFVSDGGGKGLAGLCRVLYNANEFVYVD